MKEVIQKKAFINDQQKVNHGDTKIKGFVPLLM